MATRRKPALLDLPGQPDPRAPLDWQQFLTAAWPVLKLLRDDLHARAKASSSVQEALVKRHDEERKQKRTGDSLVEWTQHFLEQVAAAWLLSCVFVRTLEDRGLLGHNRIAGPGAADSLRLFLEIGPSLNERDYLLTVFRELTRFPSTKDLFDERHNPVWLLAPSAEAAKALVQLFQQPRAELPAFRFGDTDTAFLGWLYQDLDASVRERFALLQTPRFVESFILDRTLEPAIEKFGLDDTTLIDPTCGSGHFLLGAFDRLFEHRLRTEPGLSPREAAIQAIDAVFGADLNPYAVAITRFRLTLAFFEKAGFTRLSAAPAFPRHVVVADSLLHNPHVQQPDFADIVTTTKDWRGEEYALEDEAAARAVLHRQYGAVVGNPPYITVKDPVLREEYRGKYPRSAAGKYSVAAPFTERFFQSARQGGRVGMITANSFMKREFGKKLIEQYLPTVNLDAVINTSGAYIPGHGTPTVLLFGSAEPPTGTQVATVLASRGEPSTPDDAEQGLVWRSIVDHGSEAGFDNEFISVAVTSRDSLAKHPWSLGGGGATELKELLEERAEKRLTDVVEDIGFASFTGLDDAFIIPSSTAKTIGIEADVLRPMVTGEDVRDWAATPGFVAITPYTLNDHEPRALDAGARWARFLWRYRTNAKGVLSFGGKTRAESGENWWEWYRWQTKRYAAPFRITFAFVATHNHFVLDRGGKVFNRTAPIIKLADTASEDEHFALLAYLNSSTACFWLKQVMQNRAYGADSANARVSAAPWEDFYEYAGTPLLSLPIPRDIHTLAKTGAAIDENMRKIAALHPRLVLASEGDPIPTRLEIARKCIIDLERAAASLQEALDWAIYRLFGFHSDSSLCSTDSNDVPGARSFECVAWAGSTAGSNARSWWSRAGYMEPNVSLTTQRARVESSASGPLQFLERFDFKRWWRSFDWEGSLRDELSAAVLDDAEVSFRAAPVAIRKVEVGTSQRARQLQELGSEHGVAPQTALFAQDAVPFAAAHQFNESGLERHAEWERTWDLQRREDAGEKIKEIPVPPKYGQGDYRSTTIWQLRGPLDVPKERFISYPGCASDQDGEPVYGWAGWDHEQRARALATLYVDRRDNESWAKERLTPMLAGLLELVPWLKQWHGAASDDYAGAAAGAYYEGFVDEECRKLGLTHADLRAWRPEKAKTKAATKKPATEVPSKGDWRFPDTLTPATALYFAVASALIVAAEPVLRWRIRDAAMLTVDGKRALTFLDAVDAKEWRRRVGDDHKKILDGAALRTDVDVAIEEWKRQGLVVEADGRLSASDQLDASKVALPALLERARFVVARVTPKLVDESTLLPLLRSKEVTNEEQKRRAVRSKAS